MKFSRHITSINESSGRTKEELIAIYRYWLFRGLDQTSLAYYRNNTSQQDISRYLSQIRCSIYKDFVPCFLGAAKDREFYLNHNNLTVKEIHRMDIDELAIIADGM